MLMWVFDCSLLQDSRAVRFFDRKVSNNFEFLVYIGSFNFCIEESHFVFDICKIFLNAFAGLLYSSW